MHTMKLGALLHKTRIKVLRLEMCTSMTLRKMAHQTWRDHPFSQRNKTTELAVGMGFGGGGQKKFEKGEGGGGGRQYRGGGS